VDVCKEENKSEFLAEFAGNVLAGEREWEDRLSQTRMHPLDIGIFIAALAGTLLLAFLLPVFLLLWVASSLFIIMFYPLTIILPPLVLLTRAHSETTIRAYLRTIRGIGIIRHRDSFVYVLWNAFFINSQPLAVPIILLCISDLVTVVMLILFEIHPLRIILIIVGQSVVIIIYYLSLYYLKPYSHRFLERMRSMRRRFHQKGYAVFIFVAATGILGLVLTVSALLTFLFPGITVWEVLNEGKFTPVKNFTELVLIFLVQYVIVRFMHGLFSRRLMERINRTISGYITSEVLPALEMDRSVPDSEFGPDSVCEDYRAIATLLIEAKMYKTQSASILGHFPVYYIQPDLSMILDKETLGTLRGHIEIRT
jgi:hypothetical protein